MFKYRILEVKGSNDFHRFYPQKRSLLFFWKKIYMFQEDIKEWSYSIRMEDRDEDGLAIIYFESYDKALAFIKNWLLPTLYPKKTAHKVHSVNLK